MPTLASFIHVNLKMCGHNAMTSRLTMMAVAYISHKPLYLIRCNTIFFR